MMQGVVLHGTGRKATLIGYSAGGKTGTAQKFDPITHKYSHTNFYASFAGFAPINNPAITVVVIFDSPMAPTITQTSKKDLRTTRETTLTKCSQPPRRWRTQSRRRTSTQNLPR